VDEDIGKLYYFNKCLMGQTLTLKQGKPEQVASSHILVDAKLQKLGHKKELPASALFSEMLRSCKILEWVENCVTKGSSKHTYCL
jgi:hypothetical protein